MCFWSSEKHSLHYSFNGTSSENHVAETVLGRTSEPISIQVERWSSLTRLPCAYILHGSVVRPKPLKLRETLCKDIKQHNVMFCDFYLVFRFYLQLKISVLKRHTSSFIKPSIYSNANIMLGCPVGRGEGVSS